MEQSATADLGFGREELSVNGTKVVMLTAGSGPELVFLHGTGTFPGFDFALELAQTHRVLIPYHVNFGESGDNPRIASIEEHVLHYMDLFDQLGLEKIVLSGFSFGGWLAAAFAIRQPQRLSKLVLAAPAGLQVDEAPPPDLFALPPQEIPAYLTHDPMVALRYFPKEPTPAFDAQLGREMKALGNALEGAPGGDPVLANWAHRITMPVLLLWGSEDRLVPVAQAPHWQKLMPDVRTEYIEGAGHLLFEESPKAARVFHRFISE